MPLVATGITLTKSRFFTRVRMGIGLGFCGICFGCGMATPPFVFQKTMSAPGPAVLALAGLCLSSDWCCAQRCVVRVGDFSNQLGQYPEHEISWDVECGGVWVAGVERMEIDFGIHFISTAHYASPPADAILWCTADRNFDKFIVQPALRPLRNLFPESRSSYCRLVVHGYVVAQFVPSDIFGNAHPAGEQVEQFEVDLVDLVAQVFDVFQKSWRCPSSRGERSAG